jgi:non-ribosomal peptide synthetase component F
VFELATEIDGGTVVRDIRSKALRCLDPGLAAYLDTLWNLPSTQLSLPAGLTELRRVEGRAEHLADEAVVVDRNRRFTYGDLEASARRIADLVRSRGVQPGECVGVEMAHSFETVAAVVAVMKCLAECVPLDTAEALPRRRAIAEEANVRLVITQSDAHYEVSAIPLDLL